jgi:uncharacterized DUF497 family protein
MEFAFDPAKDAANVAKHGVSLARASDLDVVGFEEDRRFAYGEARYRAFGLLDGVAYCLVFTLRGSTVRAVSLRRAHWKEYRHYAPSP